MLFSWTCLCVASWEILLLKLSIAWSYRFAVQPTSIQYYYKSWKHRVSLQINLPCVLDGITFPIMWPFWPPTLPSWQYFAKQSVLLFELTGTSYNYYICIVYSCLSIFIGSFVSQVLIWTTSLLEELFFSFPFLILPYNNLSVNLCHCLHVWWVLHCM